MSWASATLIFAIVRETSDALMRSGMAATDRVETAAGSHIEKSDERQMNRRITEGARESQHIVDVAPRSGNVLARSTLSIQF
jgi:hypothetical protein